MVDPFFAMIAILLAIGAVVWLNLADRAHRRAMTPEERRAEEAEEHVWEDTIW